MFNDKGDFQYSLWIDSLFLHSDSWFRGNSIVDRDSRPPINNRRPDERSPGKVVEPRGFISAQESSNQINTLTFVLFVIVSEQ